MIESESVQLITLPTFKDVHVHLREPGATQKENFETGTKAAIAGGYTFLLDMPNNTTPTTSIGALNQKTKLAEGKIWCDLGFNFGGTAESTIYFKKVKNKVFALKVYMNQTTGPLLINNEMERELIFKEWNNPQPIMVHAEGETVETAIKLAKKFKRKLHVCHVTYDQLPTITKAKKNKVQISCEVSPHHLFLSRDDEKILGSFAIMKPRLLSKTDKNKLWECLDLIDIISTDHAPHTIEEKETSKLPIYGVPGLETTLPLMLWAMRRKLISEKKIIEMLSVNPTQVFNLPDQEDTLMEVDLSKEYKICEKTLFTKCNWTPFKNLYGVGEIRSVYLRGQKIFENGKFVGRPSGLLVKPQY